MSPAGLNFLRSGGLIVNACWSVGWSVSLTDWSLLERTSERNTAKRRRGSPFGEISASEQGLNLTENKADDPSLRPRSITIINSAVCILPPTTFSFFFFPSSLSSKSPLHPLTPSFTFFLIHSTRPSSSLIHHVPVQALRHQAPAAPVRFPSQQCLERRHPHHLHPSHPLVRPRFCRQHRSLDYLPLCCCCRLRRHYPCCPLEALCLCSP